MAKKLKVEDRLKVLEEIEAVKKLKARYCYLADARDWDGFLDLFTEDFVADFGPLGKYDGKKAFGKFMKETVAEQFSYFSHMVHNPIIEVIEPEKATGTWYFHVPSTLGGEATWLQGRYDEEYVKQAGKWKINKCTATFEFITPYDKGWVKQKGV